MNDVNVQAFYHMPTDGMSESTPEHPKSTGAPDRAGPTRRGGPRAERPEDKAWYWRAAPKDPASPRNLF